MNKKQKHQISQIARKLNVLSSLLEGKRIEVTKRPEDEQLNWAFSRSLKDIAQELLLLSKSDGLKMEMISEPFRTVSNASV